MTVLTNKYDEKILIPSKYLEIHIKKLNVAGSIYTIIINIVQTTLNEVFDFCPLLFNCLRLSFRFQIASVLKARHYPGFKTPASGKIIILKTGRSIPDMKFHKNIQMRKNMEDFAGLYRRVWLNEPLHFKSKAIDKVSLKFLDFLG